jgi:hypothetical protein
MYLHSIPLAAAVLSDIKEGANEAGKMARHAFSVQHAREPLRIVAFAASDDEKRDWMHMLSTRIASAAAESQAEPTSAFASPQVFINLHTTATATNSTTPVTTTSSDSLPTVSPLSSSSSIAAPASPASSAVVENMSKARLSSSMIVRPQDRKGLGKMVQRLVEQKANRVQHHHSPKDEQPSEATTTTRPPRVGGGRGSAEASKESNRSWGEAELKLTLTDQRAGSRKSFLRTNSANFATTARGSDGGDGSVDVSEQPRSAEAELSTPRQTTFVKYKPSARPTSPPPSATPAVAAASTAPATTGWAPATKRSASARGGADSEAERRKGTTAFFGLRASSDIPTTQPPATRPRP